MKSQQLLFEKSFRYERKFFITSMSCEEVEQLIKLHPSIFSEIYYPRFVNNIYFDSINFDNFFDTLAGSLQRVKVRIRWYGNLFGFIKKPVLELKIKYGLLGRKISYPLSSFLLNDEFTNESISELLYNSSIPENVLIKLGCLSPVLLNRYLRKYFQSANGQFRLTLDSKLCFYQITPQSNTFIAESTDNTSIILELKYDSRNDEYAKEVTNNFPFRLSKSSKYICGVERLYL